MADPTIDTQSQDKPWHEGITDEATRGYVTARGLDKMTAAEALVTTIQAHRNAESKLGAPADQLIRWPQPGDAAGLASIYERLGRPKTANDYDFTEVKKPDGQPDMGLINALREAGFEAGLSSPAAVKVAQAVQKARAEELAASEKASAYRVAEAKQKLADSWGPNAPTNQFIAERAATLMGLSKEFLNTIANHEGYATVMEGLRVIGERMGESKLIGSDGPGSVGNRVMTREEAMAKKDALLTDREFGEKWFKGDQAAARELAELDRLIVGLPARTN